MIKKISNRTTGLAVGATVTQTGIFKSAVTQQSSIQRLQNLSQSLVPKVANTTQALINHLLFDTEGGGFRNLYDFLLIESRPSLGLTKFAADAFSFSDSIFLHPLVKNREPIDNLTTNEAIAFLIRSQRQFYSDVTITENKYALLNKSVADAQAIADYLNIIRGKNLSDSIATNEQLSRIISVYRTFDDAVGMLDAFTFIDGSTYSLDRHISEFLTIGSDATGVRQAGNNLENISFVMDKFLDPDVDMLDLLAKGFDKGLTDQEVITELNRLSVDKPTSDTLQVDALPALWSIKPTFDTFNLYDLVSRSINKTLSDVTTMIDDMEFIDHITYDYSKLFQDLLPSIDATRMALNKVILNEATAADLFRTVQGKGFRDTLSNDEKLKFDVAKSQYDYLDVIDRLIFVRGRDYIDAVTNTDSNNFYLTKLLADSVRALDPFVEISDGATYYNIVNKHDEYTPTDYFARSVQFIRYPHHGFLSPVTPLEHPSQLVLKDAKAGALTVAPIVRTNLIEFSEEFDKAYWTKTGINLTANAANPPSNVVSSSSTTYDADQLEELFTNNQWYQLVPTRWKASSNGDLLVASNSYTSHTITSATIPTLGYNTLFSFAIHLKYAGNRYVKIGAGASAYAIVDVFKQQIISSNSIRVNVKPVGEGWILCWVVGENDALFSYQQKATVTLLDSSFNTIYTGDGSSGVYVWGAQLEVGDQPEQEVSDLKYIRTAGGIASRVGFNVTPTDNDRVFVGTLQRAIGRAVNDQYEAIYLYNTKVIDPITNLAPATDYFARSANIHISPVLNDSSGLGATVTIGSPNLFRTPSDTETIAFWFNKKAKNASSSVNSVYKTVRTNLIRWSERLDYNYWTKTNTRATTGIATMAGALPYRNVVLDADQLYDIYHNKKYTYQGNRWYDIVPLKNKPNFTSNAIIDIFESSSNSIHTVSTFGYAQNLSGNFFASSIYASPSNGVTKFRLQVGWVWADFDLSSVSVITSSGTLYNNIRTMDSSSGWYLCQIVGPTQALGVYNFVDSQDIADRIALLRPSFVGNDPVYALDRSVLFTNLGKFDTQIFDDRITGKVIKKEFSETRMIPQNPRFDAMRVAGLNLVKSTTSAIDLNRYTPLSGGTNYYKAYDWYSEVPLYSRARFAVGNAGIGPLMLDNMQIGDGISYNTQITLDSRDNFITLTGDSAARFIDKAPGGLDRTSVTVGGDGGFRKQSSQSSSETTKFFYQKQFDETKAIPRYPSFDASHINEMFYATQQNIDTTKYSPLDGNPAYFKRSEWYSEVPRFGRPRFALGQDGGRGPIMLDYMQIGDGITYAEAKLFYDSFFIGTTDGFRSAGDTSETVSAFVNKDAKQGVFTDLYIAKQRPTKFEGNQINELFYGTSNNVSAYIKNNPYKKSWFQLAPYYSSYEHIKATPADRDRVYVGSVRGGNRERGWPQEILLIGAYKTLPVETVSITEKPTRYIALTAKRSVPTSSYTVSTIKTNYIPFSEAINNTFWNRNNVYISTPVQVMSGEVPYRNVRLDASQVSEFFMATSNNIAATNYYNNYYQRQWFNPAPLLHKKPFLANIQEVLYDAPTPAPRQHFVQSNVTFQNVDTPLQYFSMSVYASSTTANLRLDVGNFGNVYCDFNLSSGTVITSVGTIHNRITLIDTAMGVYLCQIVGPIIPNSATNIQYETSTIIRVRLNDNLVPVDKPGTATRYARVLEDISTNTDDTTEYEVIDMMLGSAITDASGESGTFDYMSLP